MFKKIIFAFIVFFIFLFLATSVFAQTKSNLQEKITGYDVVMEVQDNGDVKVKEKIDYDFGNFQKHGIYRDIPYTLNQNGVKKILEIQDVKVFDENNNAYNFTSHKSGGNLQIKIGDPDVLITGPHVYVIEYAVKKPFVFLKDFDRLSWNAIGTEWQVPIEKAKVSLKLTSGAQKSLISTKCFFGRYGSTALCASDLKNNQNKVFFVNNLNQEGITIDLDFQKGFVLPPTQSEIFWSIFKKWWPLIFPFIFLFFAYRHWKRDGQDPKGRGTIITQFDAPMGLTPAEIGVIYDEKADNKDIWAEIVYLAIQGFLKIERLETSILKKTDYKLIRLRSEAELQNDFDKILYHGLFTKETEFTSFTDLISVFRGQKLDDKGLKDEVTLSDLKFKFQKVLAEIQNNLYEGVVKNEYFVSNPEKKRRWYKGFGVFAVFFGVWMLLSFWDTDALGFAFALIISGALSFFFAWIIPARTQKGVEAFEHIQGLKQYLTVAEKDRINFHNAPEKSPQEFEKFLPIAMALGVETKWAKQFADLEMQEPSWYAGGVGSHFSSLAFASALGDFSSQANSTMAASSGGGGGVGGGGGGGGGGSW